MGLNALGSDGGFTWCDGSPVSKQFLIPTPFLILHVLLVKHVQTTSDFKSDLGISFYLLIVHNHTQ